ncbi:winged helix-turn-helix transcriptional regulator [Pedobacter sp. MR2016-24]|uniref:winged helix-turn-helix transcriptional regulator n=1 Tax=Pedobacter sp. MR2016-24 TaxID=2994466 RepID=UPI0022460973|nr:helix-turn-helix domain-containing protein [Pedobacter sp. MR2016-24]MCX2485764.1 helix-turn-helix domain-containing protein [Pedobacter sp. MR2016-24]
MAQITKHPTQECKKSIQAVHDAMYVLGGKWKISIVASLLFGPRRYSEILRDVVGISGKMLSRELKEMETNLLVDRIVSDTQPITVTYELTKYGKSIEPVIITLGEWGETHRKCITRKD